MVDAANKDAGLSSSRLVGGYGCRDCNESVSKGLKPCLRL